MGLQQRRAGAHLGARLSNIIPARGAAKAPLLGAAAACALSGAALAQPASGPQVGEVIVTAQRREQALTSVPMTIQALSGQQLLKSGVKDVTSLQFTSPGVLPDTQNTYTQVYIRGVGNPILIGADPSVATFIDDVPQIYGNMIENFIDVERVEILKGAQGGLYGRNATAGVINIITSRPTTDAFKGEARVDYGQKNTFEAAGHVNVPLGDRVALSLAGYRASHDPYIKNTATKALTAAMFPNGAVLPVANGTTPVAPGLYAYTPQQTADLFNRDLNNRPLGDQDLWAFKGKLRMELSDTFAVTLGGGYANKRDNVSGTLVDTTPAATAAALPGVFATFGIATNFPPGLVPQTTGKWSMSQGFPAYSYLKDWNLSSTAVWNAPGVDLTSITAYRKQHSEFSGDAVTTSVVGIPLLLDFRRKYFYQELRGVSTFEGPLHLIGGATYLDNRQNGQTDVYYLSLSIPVGSTVVADRIKNWSIYGDIGYDITDRLNLEVSARYMRETNAAHFTKPVISQSRSVQSKLVPSATLSYKIDGGNIYARWARGFKTGGINITTAPVFFPKPTDGSLFGPETVDSYEVGYKQSLMDRRLQLTAALFYNDYRNLQVDVRPRPAYAGIITQAFVNAKSARTYGAEGSITWRATDSLTLALNGGYLNAKYKDFSLSGSTVLSDFDLSGQQMAKSPKFQMSANADLNQPITDRLNLTGDILVAHTSSVIFVRTALPGVLPDAVAPAYWVVNVRAGVATADGRYALSIIADNLFDKVYFTSANASAFNNIMNYGKRRIVRAELSARF
jgi:iron complex outermembrane receptor protein